MAIRLSPAVRAVPPIGAAARRRARGSIILPSLVAGLLLAVSLPPFGFWPAGIAGAAVLWWRRGGLGFGDRRLGGWVAGLGLFVPGLWWATGFNVYGGIVLMVAEAVTVALAAGLCPPGRGRTIGLAGAMILAEALRERWPFGGLPIGSPALGQAAGPLATIARIGGPLALLGLLWVAGAALGALVLALAEVTGTEMTWRRTAGLSALSGPGSATATGRSLLLGGVTSVVIVLGGTLAGMFAPAGGPAVGHVIVGAVQGGGVRGLSQSQVDPGVVTDAQVEATALLPSPGTRDAPQLVLWPEDVVALPDRLGQDPGTEASLSQIATAHDATFVTGITEDLPANRFRNEIVAFGPDGRLVARFEKVHRVPFGEYVPDRAFFSHLASLAAVPKDAVPGNGSGLLVTPAGRLGAMVSYEVFYPGRGRSATRAGAQLLIVPTNTSSYRTGQVPGQEIAAARLQALSEGRDLVQAAPTGYSAIVDHDGRLRQRTGLGNRQVLVATVALRRGATLYERAGDLGPVLVAAAAWLGAWILYGLGSRPGAADARRRRRLRRASRWP
jgi:apolipoprotein N-acyltransferase